MRLALLLSASLATAPVAQASCATDAMLVFDGSASMARISEDPGIPTRIVEARAAVERVMPQVERFRRIGLMTYGPGGGSGCSGIDIKFPPKPMAAGATIAEIAALAPEGKTPISAAIQVAAELLDYRTEPAIIVVVTDGDETCGGRACDVAARLANDAEDLTIHVIGFRGEGRIFSWQDPTTPRFARDSTAKCFADRTDGVFAATRSEAELVRALQMTLGCLVLGRLG
ncbi:vWA domain-containing protein [Jannaschia seohaensis]|uniref:Ca-activated chloride channel family protein n=1 Tax=Jannaschia seohaensis TaxID=475081 RepID=A0A2Y9C0S5_9RHOB|nr:vWA domain-containing protein [Jannaschia seohaensis]PWJ18257.1 Ca-activated chloride channel family protein [Jannaschia seohaensis]SSA46782.1 Ca-activated chloride channel family protein [Jannaschia seohaensis]